MNEWPRRLKGSVVMGLIWAIGWGMIGGLIELLNNLFPVLEWTRAMDMWIQGLAIPGFFAGAIFSVVLQVAGRGRKFSELSLPRFAAWGAVGGLILGMIAMTLFGVSPDRWLRAVVVLSTLTAVSAASASGTLLLARGGEVQKLGSGE